MLETIIFIFLCIIGIIISHHFVVAFLEGNNLKKFFSHIILIAIFSCFYILGKF
jgi:hypothetical protein